MELKEVKTYYNNGVLRSHYFYDNKGNLHGEYKSYRSNNGQLWFHHFYNNGRLNGEYKIYRDNGQLWKHCFYIDDNEISKEEWYGLQMKKKLERVLEWEYV